MRTSKSIHLNYQTKRFFVVATIILLIFMGAVILITRFYQNDYISTSIKSELSYLTEIQNQVLEEKFDQELGLLEEIEALLENGVSFDNEESRQILTTIFEKRNLSTLAFADISGNAVDCTGAQIGNISDQIYFTDIVSEGKDFVYHFADNAEDTESHRFFLSVPVRIDGELQGVLFESMEESTLQKYFFSDDVFTGDVGMFLLDSDLNLLLHNPLSGEEHDQGDAFFQEQSEDLDELRSKTVSRENGTFRSSSGKQYISYMPLSINGWYLVCLISSATANSSFSKNGGIIIHLVNAYMMIFWVMILISAFLLFGHIRTQILENRFFLNQNNRYSTVFEKMGYAVVTYDVQNNKITSSKNYEAFFHVHHENEGIAFLNQIQKQHPEIPFGEFRTKLKTVIYENRTGIFETLLINEGVPGWISITLVPIADMNDKVTHVVAVVRDDTLRHQELEEALKMFDAVPGGIIRGKYDEKNEAFLSVDFFSDSLSVLTGFTRDRLEQIFIDHSFVQLLYRSDQEKYKDFIARHGRQEGTDSITFHFVCQTGDIITVSETMESRRDENNIMHGYAVLIDVTNFTKKTEELEKELKLSQERLLRTRIKISTGQMQPHFLYNALSSIREIVLVDPKYASDLIYNFTVHLRACVRALTSDDLIPFRSELDNIKAYIAIEKMRFGERLQLEYNIEAEDFSVIPLGVQPFVENSVRHGIYQNGSKGGKVIISSWEEQDSWVIQISDNGVGFDTDLMKEKVKATSEDSTGIDNQIFRFGKIMNATVNVDSQIGVGTEVKIIIPKGDNNENNSS